MSPYSDQVVDERYNDRPVADADVYVWDMARATLIDLFDEAGQPIGNPLSTDAYGVFRFWAEDGVYSLEIIKAGLKNFRDKVIQVGEGIPLPDSVLLQLSAPSGASLVGFSHADDLPTFALLTILREGPAVVAHRFRKGSDPDDTLSLERALATGFPVYLQAGQGTGPAGEYHLSQPDVTGATSLIRRSHVRLFGDGLGKTIIRPHRTVGYALHGVSNSPDPANNYRNIRITDIGFLGWVVEEGFEEQTHLLALSGVSDVRIERCAFTGWRGDAVYIGQGNVAGLEIHNERVTIRDCVFDGVNNNNRNGVSIIDCDTSLIENCTFLRSSRAGDPNWTSGAYDVFSASAGPGMPGAIDFEPDANNARIRNVTVRGNSFIACSGNVASIGILIPEGIAHGNCRGFLIEGNYFRDSTVRGAEIFAQFRHLAADPLGADEPGHQIIIRANQGWGGGDNIGPIHLYCAKDVLVEGNSFADYGVGNLWGNSTGTFSNRIYNCTVRNNSFVRCARTAAGRLMNIVFGVDLLTFAGNTFDDCGDGSAFANIWNFNSQTSSYVSLLNNVVVSPTGKTANNVVVKEAGHTFTPATNRQQGNDFGGRVSFFEARQSDLAQGFVPVMEGGDTAGVGTYTRQYGEYVQSGDWVRGFVNVAVTGHTGVGVIELSVPIDPADMIGPDWVASVVVETSGAGAPGAGLQVIGQVHGFASTSLGNGAIRLYTFDPATGIKAPLNIQNVAYAIYANFAYRVQVTP